MESSRAVVSSGSSAEEGSTSKLTHEVVGRIQLLPGYWLKATLSFLPQRPFHRTVHNTAAGFIKASKQESTSCLRCKTKAIGFL